MSSKSSQRDAVIKQNIAFMYGRNVEDLAHDPDKRSFVKSIPKLVETRDMDVTSFSGDFDFLAPDFPCDVYLFDSTQQPERYPSFEHALQASKEPDGDKRQLIQKATTAREAKRLAGRGRESWKEECPSIAEKLLRDKFIRNKELRNRLSRCSSKKFWFTNTYGDLVWGVDGEKRGQNLLGKIISKIRDDIVASRDLELWLSSSIPLLDSDSVNITVVSTPEGSGDSSGSETIAFESKNRVDFGKMESNDVVVDHPTVSRSHAWVLASRNGRSGVLVDLGSANGTFIDEARIESYLPLSVTSKSQIRFGLCPKTFLCAIDPDAGEKRRTLLYTKVSAPPEDSKRLQSSGIGSSETTVFVQSIPETATEAEIKSFFWPECGEVKELTVPKDRATGRNRGMAIVTMATPSGFLQAMSRDGDEFQGKLLRIRKHVPRGEGTTSTVNTSRKYGHQERGSFQEERGESINRRINDNRVSQGEENNNRRRHHRSRSRDRVGSNR